MPLRRAGGRAWLLSGVIAGLLALVALVAQSARASAEDGAGPIFWGAYVDGGSYGFDNPPWDMRALDAFEADAGKPVSILQWGQAWLSGGAPQEFWSDSYERVRQRGSIPMINWNSWELGVQGNQPDFSLYKIADGTYDDYIRRWASDAKAWGHPFFLRFDGEMNGWWYPWSEEINNNSPGEFVKAWRHVHDIFKQVGATNATWVWSVNVESPGRSLPLERLYPGDDYVDWLAIDGYNWGDNNVPGSGWFTFAEIFGPTYAHLATLAPSKPIMISEVAASERGGSKAAWISDLLAQQLPRVFPHIRALIWFNWNDSGMDWVIESSPAAQQAFHDGIAAPYYSANEYADLPFGPVLPPGALPDAPATTAPPATAVPSDEPTAKSCVAQFSDASPTDFYYAAATYLYCHGIISGYDDGTLRAHKSATRGATVKLIVLGEGWPLDTRGGPHFTDLPVTDPLYPYIETAFRHRIISGYADGTFRAAAFLSRPELCKLIVLARGWSLDTGGGPHFNDVQPDFPWYAYIETAYHHGAISGYADGSFRPNVYASRGQVVKVLYTAITSR